MSDFIPSLFHERGETVTIGLRARGTTPDYTGDETVTMDVKKVDDCKTIPSKDIEPLFSLTPTFVEGSGDTRSAWMATLSSEQTEDLEPGLYMTNAKIVKAGGVVTKTMHIVIQIKESVT